MGHDNYPHVESESNHQLPRRSFMHSAGGVGIVGMGVWNQSSGSPPADEAELTLVDDETTSAIILWWSNDSGTVAAFAAEELRKYLLEMTGVEIPIEEGEVSAQADPSHATSGVVVLTDGDAQRYRRAESEEGRTGIPTGWIKRTDKALTETKPDSFVLQTRGRRLMIGGSTHRGTLYGAYEFLEKLGVRFFAPDFDFYEGNSEYVPSKSTVTTTSLDVVEEPSLEYRRKYVEEGWSHTDLNLPKLIDWMAKNRHNVLAYPSDYRNFGLVRYDMWREDLLPELEKRGMMTEVGGHGFDSFLKPDEYEEDHPEWFVDGYNVFNVTEQEAVETYTTEVVAYLEDRPEIDIFDAWPPDGASWPPIVVEEFGSIANAYAHVVNELTAAIEADLSHDVKVEAIAYASHKRPPNPEAMYNDSTIIDFAPWDRNYEVPIFSEDSSVNWSYVELIEDWKEDYDGEIGLYEYYRKYLWHSMPVVLGDLISREVPFFESRGVNGLGIYSEPADWIPYELNHLLVARLSWDADLDGEAYVQNYLQHRYGSVWEGIETYVRLVEEASRRIWDGSRNSFNELDVLTESREEFLSARDALESAKNRASDDGVVHLITRLQWNLRFAIADVEIDYYDLLGEDEKSEQARERAEELVEAHRFDGVLLQSKWIMNRVADGNYLPENEWMRETYREEFGSKDGDGDDPDDGDGGDGDDGDPSDPETVHYEIGAKTITPDGDLETNGLAAWSVADDGTVVEHTDGDAAATIGGDVWLSWDADNLYFQAAIDDQTHSQPYEVGRLYRGDAIQFAVAPGADAWSSFLQYTFALTQDDVVTYGQVKTSSETLEASVREFDSRIVRDDASDVTTYEIAVPWSEFDALDGFDPASDDWVGVDWAILDDDNDERAGLENHVRWDVTGASAITGGKQPEHLKVAQLLD